MKPKAKIIKFVRLDPNIELDAIVKKFSEEERREILREAARKILAAAERMAKQKDYRRDYYRDYRARNRQAVNILSRDSRRNKSGRKDFDTRDQAQRNWDSLVDAGKWEYDINRGRYMSKDGAIRTQLPMTLRGLANNKVTRGEQPSAQLDWEDWKK